MINIAIRTTILQSLSSLLVNCICFIHTVDLNQMRALERHCRHSSYGGLLSAERQNLGVGLSDKPGHL